jgi:emp24/gp25L/p24 family/GOLD
LVDSEAKNFAIDIFHMTEKGKLVLSQKIKTFNSRDVYVHNESSVYFTPDGPIYVCLQTNTTKSILVEVLPNLMLPDQESFPSVEDAGTLTRELFLTNSRIMQLINQHQEFEDNERRGLEANIKLEDNLRYTMFIQLSIIVVIAAVQYISFRSLANKLRKM